MSPKSKLDSFSRSLDSLRGVVEFVDRFAVDNIPDDQIPVVQLVIEEIFTNMVRHNAAGQTDIHIELTRTDQGLTITISDLDSPPFDIRDQKEVDVTAPIRDRKPGGLGIHLVKHLVDEIHYRYKGGESVVTLIKNLDQTNV